MRKSYMKIYRIAGLPIALLGLVVILFAAHSTYATTGSIVFTYPSLSSNETWPAQSTQTLIWNITPDSNWNGMLFLQLLDSSNNAVSTFGDYDNNIQTYGFPVPTDITSRVTGVPNGPAGYSLPPGDYHFRLGGRNGGPTFPDNYDWFSSGTFHVASPPPSTNYTISLTGTGGGVSKTTSFTLTVTH